MEIHAEMSSQSIICVWRMVSVNSEEIRGSTATSPEVMVSLHCMTRISVAESVVWVEIMSAMTQFGIGIGTSARLGTVA